MRSPSPLREARRASSPYHRPASKPAAEPKASAQPTDHARSLDPSPRFPEDSSPRWDGDQLRLHATALLCAIGDQAAFDVLAASERQRRVKCLLRFLRSVAARDDEATHGDDERSSAAGAEACSEMVAEGLAGGLRRTAALRSLSIMAAAGGEDAHDAFACLRALARLGLVDALCRDVHVRTAVLGGVLASRSDEQLATWALPCLYALSSHPLMLATLCANSQRITPLLERHLHTSTGAANERSRKRASSGASGTRAAATEEETIPPAKLAECARCVLACMHASKAKELAVLHEADASDGGTRSARSRLSLWLRPRPRRSTTDDATASKGDARAARATQACVTI